MNIYILLLTVIMAVGWGITFVCCRRYIRHTYHSIDMLLDSILSKKTDMSFSQSGEDRMSKLSHKAARIMDMFISETAQTNKEKETIQSFISDMSHQMKTPLTSISMYTDLLLEGNLSSDEEQEFYTRIQSGTDKLKWMMENLIKMSRLEVGTFRLTPESKHIRQTISKAIEDVMASASLKNISVSVSDFEDIQLYHDVKWTIEALTNVLENAVKYSPAASEIDITLETLPLYSKITVTDHGIGIEPKNLHLIFKRFYRGENAKQDEGVGLGLYLASLIMEKQGGYITAASVPEEFTSFSLFLQNCQ